jgi:hypothetical protein
MTAKRITECVAAPFVGCRVDRDAGTIGGVLICGTQSANGRDYPPAVFRRDYTKYESRPVNCDHGAAATVDRRFGWFTDVKPGADGRPRGTLNCLKSHPMYARVMEAAERNPALFGFSHVAICRTRPGPDGRDVVEAIDSVESIDLVAEPATTTGLFEGRTVSLTVKQLAEALVKHPRTTFRAVRALKRLAEMDGTAAAPATADVPADDADPQDALDRAFLDAARAEMKACLDAKGDPARLKTCLAKLKKMLQAHAEIVADEDGDADSWANGDGDPAPESRAASGAAVLEALAVCESLGFRPDGADLRLLAAAAKGDREALTAKLRQAAEGGAYDRPTSTGRGRIDPAVSGTGTRTTTAAVPPTDAKAFAEWVQ